jgi:hypothetical protein
VDIGGFDFLGDFDFHSWLGLDEKKESHAGMTGWWLCLFLSMAQAGYLRMIGQPNLEIQRVNQKTILKGEYRIVNDGDEEALQVYPELQIDQFHWQGEPENLKPQQGASWKISEELKSLCRDRTEKCLLALPSEGEFLVKVQKHYQDMNAYHFVVPDLFTINSSRSPVNSQVINAELKIRPPAQGETIYQAEYTARNNSAQRVKVLLTPLFPQEIQLHNEALVVEIPANGEIQGSFEFENAKGLPNSNYVGMLSAEWAEGTKRQTTFAYASFQIGAAETPVVSHWTADQIFWAWWLWSLVLGMIGMWAFWLRPLKKLRH